MSYEIIQEYFSQETFQRQVLGDPLFLMLTVAGEKPATDVKELADVDLTLGDVAAELAIETREASNFTFASPDESRFEMLEGYEDLVRGSDEYHRVLGEFFGYPADVIAFYIENRTAYFWSDVHARRGTYFPEDLGELFFVPYVVPQTREWYDRAIETGRQRRETLVRLAEEWDAPALAEYVSNAYEASVRSYQKEAAYSPSGLERVWYWYQNRKTPQL